MGKKLASIFILLVILLTFITADAKELLLNNQSFENASGAEISGWEKSVYRQESGVTDFLTDENTAKAGLKSVRITNLQDNDARLKQEVAVRGDTFYKISCFVKTEDIGYEGKGANISIDRLFAVSKDLKGTTSGWEYIELTGKTVRNQKSFTLTIGIGGYGSMNKGTAWFDDVKVEELDSVPQDTVAVSLALDDSNSGNAVGNKDNGNTGKVNSPEGAVQNTGRLDIYAISLMLFVMAIFIIIFKIIYDRSA
jgi:hypothetical protein